MKVFLSWSGEHSRELAEALREWLPGVLQSVKPFFTPSDIEKGARWNKDISQELESSSFGIFCLTKENLTKPWIMFEAGALSRRIDTSKVCPVLFDVESADLEGPLVQFQAAPFSEHEVRKLVKTLNTGLGDQRLEEDVLSSVFEMWWPKLNGRVSKIMESYAGKPGTAAASRSDRDLLEEVLELARLNASSDSQSFRSLSERFDRGAFLHSLRYMLLLIEQIESVINTPVPMLPNVREMFAGLKYLAEINSPTGSDRGEINETIRRISVKLESAN